MNGLLDLYPEQNPKDLKKHICIHSKVAAELLDDWRDIWDLYIRDPRNVKHNFTYLEKNGIDIYLDKRNREKHLLVCILRNGDNSLLFSTGRQQIPRCNKCASSKCKC